MYPVWFSHFAMGAPSAVHAAGSLSVTGVDVQAALTLEYPGGAQALATTTMTANTRTGAVIAGTLARIEVEPMFITPAGFTLHGAKGERLDWRDDHEYGFWRDGLVWQAAAVAQHISDGLTQAPEHPLATTIAVLETIDDARTQLGYPPV